MITKELTEESSRSVTRFLCGTASLGRNDAKHAEFVIEEPMMMLRIVADVGQQRVEGMSPMCLSRNTVQFKVVGLGAAVDHNAEEQVALDVNYRRKLGISMKLPPSAAAEVCRGVGRFQAGRIDSSQDAAISDQAAPAGESKCCIQQASSAPFFRRRPSA